MSAAIAGLVLAGCNLAVPGQLGVEAGDKRASKPKKPASQADGLQKAGEPAAQPGPATPAVEQPKKPLADAGEPAKPSQPTTTAPLPGFGTVPPPANPTPTGAPAPLPPADGIINTNGANVGPKVGGVLIGTVRVPAALIGNNSGGLIGNHAASYSLLAASPKIEVGLVDAAGALLPGTSFIPADAEGKYAFEKVPVEGGCFVQARVTIGDKTHLLGNIAQLTKPEGNTCDITAASTLVTEKARVVLGEQDKKLTELKLEKLAALIAALEALLAEAGAELPDLTSGGAAVAAALDKQLQQDSALGAKAKEVDRNVACPIVRTKSVFAQGIFSPEHLAYDPAGNLFVAGLNDHTVWKIPAGSDKPEVFYKGGDLKYPHGITCDKDGNVYVGRRIDLSFSDPANTTGGDTPGKQVFKISPDGKTVTTLAHTFAAPNGMAFAPDGKTLMVVNAQGICELVAYDTSTDTARVIATGFTAGNGVAVDSSGLIYVSHLRYDASDPDPKKQGWRGAISTVTPVGFKSVFYAGVLDVTGKDYLEGLAFDAAENLYVTNNWGNTIFKFTPKQKKIETYLKFNQPTGIAFDPKGNLVVADYIDGTISRITP